MLKFDLKMILRLDVSDSQIIIMKKIAENKEIIDPIEEIMFQKVKRSG